MVNDSYSDVPQTPHRCDLTCLGPLTFHCHAVGDKIRLSEGCRLAEKMTHTFRDGLVFSSRAVRVRERIHLRVTQSKSEVRWHGALRLGFTTVPPSARSVPLPSMAIPNLTNSPGHWAAPIHESYCQSGSELIFWVSRGGTVYFKRNEFRKQKLLTGLDLSQPLWAMIDIYGQTCSVELLGSEKRELLYTRKSCPCLAFPDMDNCKHLISHVSRKCGKSNERISSHDTEADQVCVVCMAEDARITLPCGHRCLCTCCVPRVVQQFGTCPLCRHEIRPFERRTLLGAA